MGGRKIKRPAFRVCSGVYRRIQDLRGHQKWAGAHAPKGMGRAARPALSPRVFRAAAALALLSRTKGNNFPYLLTMEQCAHVASSIRMSDKLRASSETWTRACYFVCCTHITTAENEIVYGVKEPQGRPLDPHSLCKGQLYNEPEREREMLSSSLHRAPYSIISWLTCKRTAHHIPPRTHLDDERYASATG
jgi:hypothetical protein